MSGPRPEPTAEPLIPRTRAPPETDDASPNPRDEAEEPTEEAPIGTVTRVP